MDSKADFYDPLHPLVEDQKTSFLSELGWPVGWIVKEAKESLGKE
jgi:hypothetical protein